MFLVFPFITVTNGGEGRISREAPNVDQNSEEGGGGTQRWSKPIGVSLGTHPDLAKTHRGIPR